MAVAFAAAAFACTAAAGVGFTAASYLTVSPDGTQIAWVDGFSWNIWVARPDGSNAHVLAHAPTGEGISDMHWTEQGLLVDSNFTVYLLRPGRKARVVIPGKYGGFEFAAGGTRVATGLERAPGPYAVVDVRSGARWLLGARTAINNYGALSPDGTRAAWSSRGGIWTARLGGPVHRLAAKAGCPAWSPDGKRISFTRLADLRVIPANGGRSKLLAAKVGGCQQTAWSPDSSSLAFAGPRGVVVVDARTGKVARLPQALGETFYPAWAPNGTLYVSSRPPKDAGTNCLNLATAAGVVVVRGCP